MKKEIDNDYKLIPMKDIDDEAREIAVRWMECDDKNWIAQKHKLASDIMNYARRKAKVFSSNAVLAVTSDSTENKRESEVAVAFADCFAFAEYFKNTFEFYDCNANGRIYNYIDFSRRGRLLTMQEIFDEWKAKETDR